ncbi:MAG: hypothetical protein WBI07_04860 [Mobilitalea sp.]
MEKLSMTSITEWLIMGEPYIEYNTRLHLLRQQETEIEVVKSRERMLLQPEIQSLLIEFGRWEEEIISNHKNAGLLLHKLVFLADIGLNSKDSRVKEIADIIGKNRTAEGVVRVPINVPIHFGGTGENSLGWCLCDTPLVLYAFAKFGLGEDPLNKMAFKHLMSFMNSNGWGCKVSEELGKFRGPGKKEDPCPYATLLMLKVMTQVPEYKDCKESRLGAEVLLSLWESSRERHPYLFYMGTDFRKLKAPLVWYDLLNVADTLSQFDWLRKDSRLIEMVETIKMKAEKDGSYLPESEWKSWNGWEFSQKKKPSRWITLLVMRILQRME